MKRSHLLLPPWAFSMLVLGCSATGSEPGYGNGAGGTPNLGDAGALLGDSAAESGSFDVCAKATNPAVMVPLDMYLLLDHSQSMLIGGAWELTVEAVGNFVELPDLDGISLGLGFYQEADATGICNNDFAILQLDKINDSLEPLRLRTKMDRLEQEQPFDVVGYGRGSIPTLARRPWDYDTFGATSR